MEHIAGHLDSLPDQPVWNSENAAELARSVIEPLPQAGQPADQILDNLCRRLVPVSYNTTSPGYLAYVPGGGLPHAAVADLIAAALNRYVGVWIAAPALAQIEATVIRWFCDIFGYPAGSGGFLTTGGCLATLTAIITARERSRTPDLSRTTVYTSDQTHHSASRAVRLAAIPRENLRVVGTDGQYRIDLGQLARQIATDRANGFAPLAIVASAGTTNTGAIDDLPALADLAANEQLWLHIDAAYGGFFMLTERGRQLMRGIQRADSITVNPHKGLFLPYGTGCLLVRDSEMLRQAHSEGGDYMPSMQDADEFVDFCEISPELSRGFRGLRIWLPMKMHGSEPFRENLDEKLDLAQWSAAELIKLNEELDDDLELVVDPVLSIVVFRLRRDGLNEDQLTELNADFHRRINESRRVFLTHTMLRGKYVIRICILSFRTHHEHMETCLEEIRRAALEVAEPVS